MTSTTVWRLTAVWLGIGVAGVFLSEATVDALFLFAALPWAIWLVCGLPIFGLLARRAWQFGRARHWNRALATLATLPVAGGILVVSAPYLIRAGAHVVCCAHPSDAALIRRFVRHRSEFDRLVGMSNEDTHVTRPDSAEYRRLFRALGLQRLGRDEGRSAMVYLFASSRGMAGINPSTKGYVYSPKPLAPLFPSLDPLTVYEPDTVAVYRHIVGPWYLFYEM